MGSLQSSESSYPLLLELKEVPEMANPLQVVTKVFERLESLKTPKSELKLAGRRGCGLFFVLRRFSTGGVRSLFFKFGKTIESTNFFSP